MLTAEQIALALAAISGIVWLVRLEGRVNTLDREREAQKTELAAMKAQAALDAAKHTDTKEAVIRLQEQIGHLTNLIEKWFQPIDPPAAKRRRSTSEG